MRGVCSPLIDFSCIFKYDSYDVMHKILSIALACLVCHNRIPLTQWLTMYLALFWNLESLRAATGTSSVWWGIVSWFLEDPLLAVVLHVEGVESFQGMYWPHSWKLWPCDSSWPPQLSKVPTPDTGISPLSMGKYAPRNLGESGNCRWFCIPYTSTGIYISCQSIW